MICCGHSFKVRQTIIVKDTPIKAITDIHVLRNTRVYIAMRMRGGYPNLTIHLPPGDDAYAEYKHPAQNITYIFVHGISERPRIEVSYTPIIYYAQRTWLHLFVNYYIYIYILIEYTRIYLLINVNSTSSLRIYTLR